MNWEREMIDAACDPSCYHMQRNKALREARAACIAEHLSDPQDETDHAYDRAIRHCVAAIEALMKHQVPPSPTDILQRSQTGNDHSQDKSSAALSDEHKESK